MSANDIDKSQPLGLIHFSPIRGFSNQNTNLVLLYYGFTYQVKARDINKPKHQQLDQRKLDEIRRLIANPPPKCEYLTGGGIERFDIYDPKTGDITVMVRVPFRVTG